MEIRTAHLQVARTARYFTLGELNDRTRSVTYVFHGYGHHPKDFIDWFRPVASEQHVVVAPEGLSRFYSKGISGQVGASWMTSDDRENEIRDYRNFLTDLHQVIKSQVGPDTAFQLIGFSQGAATACRWVAGGDLLPERMFLWAGMFPPDLQEGGDPDRIRQTSTIQVISESDPYFEKGMLQNQQKFLDRIGIESELFRYEGGHDIQENDLKNVYRGYVPWHSDLF